MKNDNERLLQAVRDFQEGREDAFEELYNQTSKYVYYSILKSVKNPDVASDVLQDTYLEVYKNLSALKSPEAFKKWTSTIAQHKITHYYMKNPDNSYGSDEEEAELLVLSEDDKDLLPEDAMDSKETQRLISEILDQLPIKHREAIVAFYYNQMSITEIAEAMEVPENTVKTYLSRGKAKIKDGVLTLEKTHGTKLYTLAIAPVLFFLFAEEASACELPIEASQLLGFIQKTNVSSGTQQVQQSSIRNKVIEKKTGKVVETAVKTGLTTKTGLMITSCVVGVALLVGIGYTATKPDKQNSPKGVTEIVSEDKIVANEKTPEEIAAEKREQEEAEQKAEEAHVLAEKEALKEAAVVQEVVLADAIEMPSDEELQSIAGAYVNVLNNDPDIYNTEKFGLYDVTGDNIPEIYDNQGTIMFTYIDGNAAYMIYDMVINEYWFDIDSKQFVVHYSWKGTDTWTYYDVNVGNGSAEQWFCLNTQGSTKNSDRMELLTANYNNDSATKDEMVEVLKSYYRGETEYSPSMANADTSKNPIVKEFKFRCSNCGEVLVCDTAAEDTMDIASAHTNYVDILGEGMLSVHFYCDYCASQGYCTYSFNSKAYEWLNYDNPSEGIRLNNGDTEAFYDTPYESY